MVKITFIGAGSVVFAKQLMVDILGYTGLSDCLFCLEDINSERLSLIEKVAKMFIRQRNSKAQIVTTNSIEEAVKDADFIINLVQVGGFESTLIDFEIPAKFGLKQTIGDTLSIGGIFRALRTMPVLDEICQAIIKTDSKAYLLNYTNPMAMLSQYVLTKYPSIKYVGLCHSVQTTSKQLALYLNVPYKDLEVKVAGINHQAWFLKLENKGKDLYPELLELKSKRDKDKDFVPKHLYKCGTSDSWFRENFKDSAVATFVGDKIRFEMLKRLDYFVTESSEHSAEYCPYFLKDPKLIEKYDIPVNEYVRRCKINLKEFASMKKSIENGEELFVNMSEEYAGSIINSIVTGQNSEINGNVLNTGLITNLPQNCCVEVPCLINKNGIQPTFIGKIPEQLACYNRTNINVQMLVVEAVIKDEKKLIYQAVMLDPLCSSMLNFSQMDEMVDELFKAHNERIPYFK